MVDEHKLHKTAAKLTYKLRVLEFLSEPKQVEQGCLESRLNASQMVDYNGKCDLARTSLIGEKAMVEGMIRDGLLLRQTYGGRQKPLFITEQGKKFLKTYVNEGKFAAGQLTPAAVDDLKQALHRDWKSKVTNKKSPQLDDVEEYLRQQPEFSQLSCARIQQIATGLMTHLQPPVPHRGTA